MKKSKMIVTLAASAAVTLSLVSTAFAAPATLTYKNDQTTNNYSSQYSRNTGNYTSRNGQTSGSSLPSGFQGLFGRQGQPTPPPFATATPKATVTPQATATPRATITPQPTATPRATAKPTPTPSPSSGLVTPVSGNMSADERKMINLVNQDRADNGLQPLTFDSGLRAGALAHSQDMAQNNYFSHTSPTKGDFSARAKASGAKASAENIAKYGSVEQAEAGFMSSSGHRANILGNYTRVGIGIVSKGGTLYITQWFGR